MKIPIEINNVEFKECSSRDHLKAIVQMNAQTLLDLSLDHHDHLLRKNSIETLSKCLEDPHVTLGAWHKDKEGKDEMIAFAILYYPEDNSDENLSLDLEDIQVKGQKTANYKLCIVKKEYRGNSLQYKLGQHLEKYAIKQNVTLLCCTISPDNEHSIKSILSLGYTFNKKIKKYGLERNLYYKFI